MPHVRHALIHQQQMPITLLLAMEQESVIVAGFVIQAILKTEPFALHVTQLLAALVSTGQLVQQALLQMPHALLARIMELLIYLTPLQAQELESVIALGNVLQNIF